MKNASLFTKFTVLIVKAAIITAIITHIALFVYFSNLRNKLPVREEFYRMSKYVVNQIDLNDTASVRKLLTEQMLEMRFIGDSLEWASSNSVPSFKSIDKKRIKSPAFWHHNRLTCVTETGQGIFILQGSNPFKQLAFPWEILLIWSAVLVAIFGLAHFRIRQYLKPLRTLENGVKQVSSGCFDIDLPQTTTDELGRLIRSFNKMAHHIQNDIKARDQLLRDISHELRSPLARMLVALEFVPEGNIRQTLKNNISVLEKMTSTILEEERLDSPFGRIKPEKVELRGLLSEITENRKNNLVQIVCNDPLEINVDRERFRMALSNILDNAVKYSKPDSAPVLIKYRKNSDRVVITIEDNGIGISAKELPFIFEPFYRVDKARRHSSGGYGLGMSLTKKIIEAHNGDISIESILDKGTTVTVEIPL